MNHNHCLVRDDDSEEEEDGLNIESVLRFSIWNDDNGDDESTLDDEIVSIYEFDDDFNVVIKDINSDQCHFLLCLSLSVHLVKINYFNLISLVVNQQRMLFQGKKISDKDSWSKMV